MLCLSVGVQSGAAAGTSPGLPAGRSKAQRARRPGERRGAAGDEPAERTAVWVCQVKTPGNAQKVWSYGTVPCCTCLSVIQHFPSVTGAKTFDVVCETDGSYALLLNLQQRQLQSDTVLWLHRIPFVSRHESSRPTPPPPLSHECVYLKRALTSGVGDGSQMCLE